MDSAHGSLLGKLKWRYAVKKFDPARKLAAEQWEALQKALILTPSSYGLQPWKFVVVQNPALRAQLKAASWNQGQVEDCSHFVVFAALHRIETSYVDRYIERIAQLRNVPLDRLKGYRQAMVSNIVEGAAQEKNVFEWATRQVYIALGNLMTSAAMIDVDTCPMEGLDARKYDEILGLDEYRTAVACAVGFRSPGDALASAAKVRFNADEVFDLR